MLILVYYTYTILYIYIVLQTSIVERLPHLINVHMLCDQKRQVGQILLELGRLESDLLRASKNQSGIYCYVTLGYSINLHTYYLSLTEHETFSICTIRKLITSQER